ncbi:MAG TPA: J domain-containing protein [Candidatus Limnocylindrales bacterium]|nr:J domain-containing protein [Candidatus Limnocylindrales bacterium]
MAALRPGDDPYRILGVLRSADLDQIKAAHRRLAKRFHPDGTTGDESRFLTVQEAYQLLSDPQRRREWDRLHAPGPVRAAEAATSRRRAKAPDARAAGATRSRRQATARPARPAYAPGRRTTTWSAEHVPWWEDFRPREPGGEADVRHGEADARHGEADVRYGEADARPGGQGAPARRPGRPQAGAPDMEPPESVDFDVFSRSSGAAWSMAARRHFRRADADLPSRGVWRYRGTQVVTGAEARKVAAEEAARRSRRRAPEQKRASEQTDDDSP